jgi:hypothetical protein
MSAWHTEIMRIWKYRLVVRNAHEISSLAVSPSQDLTLLWHGHIRWYGPTLFLLPSAFQPNNKKRNNILKFWNVDFRDVKQPRRLPLTWIVCSRRRRLIHVPFTFSLDRFWDESCPVLLVIKYNLEIVNGVIMRLFHPEQYVLVHALIMLTWNVFMVAFNSLPHFTVRGKWNVS